jgi:hypothetical protein
MAAYRHVVGCLPGPNEIATALAMDRNPAWLASLSDESRSWNHALERMVDGSLQIAASELLGQGTHKRAGEDQLFSGLSDIEEIRAKNRIQRTNPRKTKEQTIRDDYLKLVGKKRKRPAPG